MQATLFSLRRWLRPAPLAAAGAAILVASVLASLVLARPSLTRPGIAVAAAVTSASSSSQPTWSFPPEILPQGSQRVNTATDNGSFQMNQYATGVSLAQFLSYYRAQAGPNHWKLAIEQQATSASLRLTTPAEQRPLEVTYSDSQHPNAATGTHTISVIRRLIEASPAPSAVPVYVVDAQQIAEHPSNYVVPEDVGKLVEALAFRGQRPVRAAYPAANTPGIALYAIVVEQPQAEIADHTLTSFKTALASQSNVAVDNVNQLVPDQSWSITFHLTGHGQVGTIHGSKALDGTYQVLMFLPQQ